MWAQSSRIHDPLKFEIDPNAPEHLEAFYKGVRTSMETRSVHERQDDYRLGLPLLSMTKYSVSISLRMLVKLGNYFDHLAVNTELKDIFQVASEEIYQMIKYLGLDISIFRKYKPHKILNEHYIKVDGSRRFGSAVVVSGALPFHLRAQLVRHRGISFEDNLFNLLQSQKVFTSSLRKELHVTIMGSTDSFREILRRRTCWIANYRVWGGFLAKIEEQIGEGIDLPCTDGTCPYPTDAKIRYEGKEPNPPCPIYCDMERLPITREQFRAMDQMIDADRRPKRFWDNKMNQLTLIEGEES
jgi:hypothetical protein